MLGTAEDITGRKQAEAIRAGLEAENHRLQKAESLGLMAGSMAHHFNNRLQAVMANLELASSLQVEGKDAAAYLAGAKLAAEKAAELSRQLLVYLGHANFEKTPSFLSRLLNDSLPHIQKDLSNTVKLGVDCPSPGPVINANAEQIREVLTNLVTNACEAMGPCGGSLRLTVSTCSAAEIPTAHAFPVGWLPSEQEHACIEVADTGCGVAQNDLEKLFDPFYSTKFTGRGLGLPIVLGIVQSHGGGVLVESRQGQGSIFRIYIQALTEAPPDQNEPVVEVRRAERGGTVLLVDDDEMLLGSTGAMIEMMGFTLLTAKDGFEAVEVFRQHQGEIRCVITDLTMPGRDGWETLSALRQLESDLPVILASGYDKAQVLSGKRSELPQAYLHKPFGFQQLCDALAATGLNGPEPT